MKVSNANLELADLRAEQERQAGIEKAQKALSHKGVDYCVTCGEEIEAKRRQALPSARRCHACQQELESRR